MSESVSISVRLGNRQYKIKVAPDNEESVRKSLLVISDTTTKLKKSFPGRDEQDYLAMTLIDFVTSNSATPTHSTSSPSLDHDPELIQKLTQISQLLDS